MYFNKVIRFQDEKRLVRVLYYMITFLPGLTKTKQLAYHRSVLNVVSSPMAKSMSLPRISVCMQLEVPLIFCHVKFV